MITRLSRSFGFEAAHWLPTFPEGHKCRRMHGHSFRVQVFVEGEVSEERGYLMDFAEIKEATREVEERLDHHVLNEVTGLENPTAENLARWIWERLEGRLPLLAEVVVHETCTSACHYRGR